MSDLEPGDLVFPADPGEHVAIYIGNGEIVQAPYTGANVQIVPLTGFFVLASRVGLSAPALAGTGTDARMDEPLVVAHGLEKHFGGFAAVAGITSRCKKAKLSGSLDRTAPARAPRCA